MKILEGEIGWNITAKSAEGLTAFVLNSPGGSLFEGLALYDVVTASGAEVGCIGICASAATLPLIASSNAWGTPNSRYLIHNPWSYVEGDAEAQLRSAEDLKKEQDRAVELYAKHLSIDAEAIQTLMNEEKFLTAEEALEIGLIKEIREFSEEVKEENKAKLLFTQFKMSYMAEPQKPEEVTMSAVEKLLNKTLAAFGLGGAKMVVLKDVNGEDLEFADVENVEDVKVGDKLTVGTDASASGEYVMPSGETYVVENGELTEIKAAEDEGGEDMEALKAENEALKAENAELKALEATMSSKLAEFNANLEAVNAKMKAPEKPEGNTPVEQPTTEKRFKFKRK